MAKTKTALIAFLGNAFFDSRVYNLRNSLIDEGFKVKVVSFHWLTERYRSPDPEIKVYNIKRRPSLFFYINFGARLSFNLIKGKYDFYFAEDVYTLPLVNIFARIKRGRVIYNSRELFGFLAGLRGKRKTQRIIAWIERVFIKRADHILTTGRMDSEFIERAYDLKNTVVVRNLPVYNPVVDRIDLKTKLGIPKEGFVIIYQGVLLEGRGIAPLIKSIVSLPLVYFVLLGDGIKRDEFMKLCSDLGVSDRVFFLGFVNNNELLRYTGSADLGVSLIENISKSYYYALPNKLFEYIMAGIPSISSDLPQMREIMEKYRVGEAVKIDDENSIRDTIKRFLNDNKILDVYKENTKKAAMELNWENEFDKIKDILK